MTPLQCLTCLDELAFRCRSTFYSLSSFDPASHCGHLLVLLSACLHCNVKRVTHYISVCWPRWDVCFVSIKLIQSIVGHLGQRYWVPSKQVFPTLTQDDGCHEVMKCNFLCDEFGYVPGLSIRGIQWNFGSTCSIMIILYC